MIRSPWGRVLRSIREDEAAAAAVGKNVFGYKLQVLILGALLGGMAGCCWRGRSASSARPTTNRRLRFTPI